ncbi:MAG: GAF domain-containing protein [Desulfobacterales bacterium]
MDQIEQQLFRVSSYGISDEYLNKGPLFVDDKYCALGTGKVEMIKDILNDDRIQYPDAAKKEGIASMMGIPIKYRSWVIGVIRIYDGEVLDFHESDVDSLCVLGNQLGLVIENNGLKNFVDHVNMAFEQLPPVLSGAIAGRQGLNENFFFRHDFPPITRKGENRGKFSACSVK